MYGTTTYCGYKYAFPFNSEYVFIKHDDVNSFFLILANSKTEIEHLTLELSYNFNNRVFEFQIIRKLYYLNDIVEKVCINHLKLNGMEQQ